MSVRDSFVFMCISTFTLLGTWLWYWDLPITATRSQVPYWWILAIVGLIVSSAIGLCTRRS